MAVLVSGVRVSARALEDPTWRPSRTYCIGLALHPAAMIVIALVPSWHGFLVTVNSEGAASYSTGFWIHVAVSYALLVAAGVRFVRSRGRIRAISRHSAVGAFLPWSLPFIANGITVSHQGAGGPEFTPIAFLVTAILIGRALVRDGLADIVPIARVHVFESFTDAIFVLDSQWCLVDANARALRLLGAEHGGEQVVGRQLDAVAPEISRMWLTHGEHDIEIAGEQLVLSVKRSPLKDVKGRVVGALVHVRDVTVDVVQRRELVSMRDALADEARANEALRAKLAEQVVRDAGTGLRNRRYVFEALPVMAESCERTGVPLSLAILAIDHFKDVNDTFGHTVGDRALQAIATALDEAADGAVVARFGGEEFVVLLPGADSQTAVETAETLREACAVVEVPAREGAIKLTLSAGVATAADDAIDIASLLEGADRALYAAKKAGRNRECVCAPVDA